MRKNLANDKSCWPFEIVAWKIQTHKQHGKRGRKSFIKVSSSTLYARVVAKTSNFVISRPYAEYHEEIWKQVLKCVSSFDHSPYVLTNDKNFNAVSHNGLECYFRIQHGRGEVRSRRFPLECSFSNRKFGRHGMICWVLAMKLETKPKAARSCGIRR